MTFPRLRHPPQRAVAAPRSFGAVIRLDDVRVVVPHDRVQRFYSRALMSPDGCYLYTVGTDEDWYGVTVTVTVAPYTIKSVRPHRFAYALRYGEIPEGKHISHLCGVKRCINPDHLIAVDRDEALYGSPRHNRNKTHCKHGHAFTPENTKIKVRPSGERERSCRECGRQWQRQYKRRGKQ